MGYNIVSIFQYIFLVFKYRLFNFFYLYIDFIFQLIIIIIYVLFFYLDKGQDFKVYIFFNNN